LKKGKEFLQSSDAGPDEEEMVYTDVQGAPTPIGAGEVYNRKDNDEFDPVLGEEV